MSRNRILGQAFWTVALVPFGYSPHRNAMAAKRPLDFRTALGLCLSLSLCFLAEAQTTYTGSNSVDAFVATGSASNPTGSDLTGRNFGAAGLLAVAPASALKGEFQSVVRFGVSNAASLFNATYGSNRWSLTSISLELACNVAADGAQPNDGTFNKVSGGAFVIEWLSNDNWSEGTGMTITTVTNGITFASLPALLALPHDALCTNAYSPPGNNVHLTWPLPLNTDLVADVAAGNAVTFRFYAADTNVGYLFNSHEYGRGNVPLIHLTATELFNITSGQFTNGLFHLAGTGYSNAQYQVQANTDISTTNWQTIGTATADTTGAIAFDDPNATNLPHCFYRLRKQISP